MTSAAHRNGPHFIASRRLANRLEDLDTVERAGELIRELGSGLDRQLANERRPAERTRMLRETTNRITRAANDAVQAYQRTSRGIREELERPDADVPSARQLRRRLDAARGAVLQALEAANQRYPARNTPPTDERGHT